MPHSVDPIISVIVRAFYFDKLFKNSREKAKIFQKKYLDRQKTKHRSVRILTPFFEKIVKSRIALNNKIVAVYKNVILSNNIIELNELFVKTPIYPEQHIVNTSHGRKSRLCDVPIWNVSCSIQMHMEVIRLLGSRADDVNELINIMGLDRGNTTDTIKRDIAHLWMMLQTTDHVKLRKFKTIDCDMTLLNRLSYATVNSTMYHTDIQQLMIYLIEVVGIDPTYHPIDPYDNSEYDTIMPRVNSMAYTSVVKLLVTKYKMDPTERSFRCKDNAEYAISNGIHWFTNKEGEKTYFAKWHSDYFEILTEHFEYLVSIDYPFTPNTSTLINELNQHALDNGISNKRFLDISKVICGDANIKTSSFDTIDSAQSVDPVQSIETQVSDTVQIEKKINNPEKSGSMCRLQ